MSEHCSRIEAALRAHWDSGSTVQMAESIDREIGHSAVCEALEDCLTFFEDAYQRMMVANYVDAGIAAGTMVGRCRAALSLVRGERQETRCRATHWNHDERCELVEGHSGNHLERRFEWLDKADVQSPGSTPPAPEASMEKGQTDGK